MSSYITEHWSGAWKYQFHIPVRLRPLLGGKSAICRYMKRMPRRDAEMIARKWALDDAAELAEYRSINPARTEAIGKAGGLDAVLNTTEPEHEEECREQRQHRVRLQDQAYFIRKWAKESKPSLVMPTSWDALFNEWVRVKAPNHPRTHKQTIGLLKEFFGERDCRKISPAEIGRWRDSLATKSTRLVVKTHLRRAGAMFSAAAREPTSPFAGMVNPVAGVMVLGKNPPPKDGSDKVFTPNQLKTILETAMSTKFGKKRHEAMMWMLRLLTYTGARPNEICQIQCGDVGEENGVKFIRIQQNDCLTGRKHPHKSVKTADARRVPLHPEVEGFYDYAMKMGKKDAFVFGRFKWNKDSGRASYLICMFPKFLHNECEIVEPTKRLTLYSLRHTFISAMRTAEVPLEAQNQIVGHGKNVHARYGAHELKLLADYIAKVKPLG